MAELESIGRETTMHNEPNKMFDIFSVPLSKSTQEKKKKKNQCLTCILLMCMENALTQVWSIDCINLIVDYE